MCVTALLAPINHSTETHHIKYSQKLHFTAEKYQVNSTSQYVKIYALQYDSSIHKGRK